MEGLDFYTIKTCLGLDLTWLCGYKLWHNLILVQIIKCFNYTILDSSFIVCCLFSHLYIIQHCNNKYTDIIHCMIMNKFSAFLTVTSSLRNILEGAEILFIEHDHSIKM